MFKKTPLAWLQVTREKTRLLVAISGISFANVLMFVQLGLRDALFDSAVRFHESLEGEIFLISPQSVALISMDQFTEKRLYQARGFKGVESVSPVYVDFARWKNPESRKTRNIFIIGFNPNEKVLNLPGVQENVDKLKVPDVVLFDEASRNEYGPVVSEFNKNQAVITEVKNRKITVEGLFTLGTSFGADGNLITSELNFLRIFNVRRTKGLIDVGVIKIKSDANYQDVLKELRNKLPDDVKVVSKEEFADFEKGYWNSSTPIGFIFALGAALGFIIGIVIVYQIIYSDISDHLPEYATLKAIGYTDRYLLFVVFQEAMILAILGYLPGVSISLIVYNGMRNATLLPIIMTVSRALLISTLTFLMCFISGAISIQKLRSADPAEIF
ncbi:ABC transporter permease DevC [Dolichospermum sp. UHCC 0684]|uniref:ABC transporter permease DevC n=1 Tax=unclassified Dolichospermum TaxID=2622029 RepID=UPI001444FF9F|nr:MULTISPECIES: ABC transporter permease DevC [unclassified Dolichospermum]MEA5529517.1 ABC transporter permease DevC [Dolichospermum sp. UHCC 0684]MTJ36288.1 FtsX-like permease family protein [Dolichospermum sp. UHCC 0260]